MEIQASTLVKDILETWPGLQEKLERIDPRAKLTATPLGRRLMQRLTVADVSRETGIPVEKLIGRLQALIEEL